MLPSKHQALHINRTCSHRAIQTVSKFASIIYEILAVALIKF